MAELTTEQKDILEKALANRQKRTFKSAADRKAAAAKKDVSGAEYQRRLLLEIQKDTHDAESRIQNRKDKNLALWRRQVGERFRDATTDSEYILERVELLRRNRTHRTSLVLAGNLGVGKTWLGYSYLNMLIKEGIMSPANMVASTETSTLVRIATGGYKRSDMFEELKNPLHKVFFIDDVGQAHFTNDSARHEVWYELIDHVYSNDLTLILTTNKSLQDSKGSISTGTLKRWLGEAAYDRMKYIMGPTGLIVPGEKNRRPEVYLERDAQ